MPHSDTPRRAPVDGPAIIGFLLIDGFSLMSFAAAVEPLRAANILSGRPLYDWRSFAIEKEITASSGFSIKPDHRLGEDVALDTVFVCAGGDPAMFKDSLTMRWLRRLARRGVRIGGISGGPFLLARAGLLDRYRCTIHWEHLPAFVEAFPNLELTRSLYEIDRGRLTCAGGVAALDMMHALIARDHGQLLADGVAEWFLQTQIRIGSGAQRRSLQERFRVTDQHLLRALEALEAAVERSPSRKMLAAVAGVSVRHLERLFAMRLGTSIDKHRQRLKLLRARALLRQSPLPIFEIALASGFASASHFSRAYKSAFGCAPREDRRRM